MSKKIVFVVASTLFLVVALFSTPLTFAQLPFEYCRIEAYGTLTNDGDNAFVFSAAVPPAGSEIPNSIVTVNYDPYENYTDNIPPGAEVIVFVTDTTTKTFNPASEPDHYTIFFEGSVSWVTVNSETIPEFPPILIIPMFITATALAIIYRRKRTSQIKKTD